jgi:hypothetical protein
MRHYRAADWCQTQRNGGNMQKAEADRADIADQVDFSAGMPD